ncbi:MAG: M50 family metallopeptidase [Ilumatobacter sp.]
MVDSPHFDASASDTETTLSRHQLRRLFGAAVALSVVLGLVPGGGYVIYPFRLFATWAHEMGHGVGAMLTGNNFDRLELYRNLGGVAFIGGADGVSQVIVSSLGLVGPAILGAIVMIAGSRPRSAHYVLAGLAVAVGVSLMFYVRNVFGFVSMSAIAAVLVLVARFAPPLWRVVMAQLLAVQLALSAWSSRDYLFISGFERDGRQFDSDTQNIADEWFLPYWFWGGLLGGLSIVILALAFWVAWVRPIAGTEPDRELRRSFDDG